MAYSKLICTFSSKAKKTLHPLRSFQHSWPRHAAGSKGFLTSLGKNDSSVLVLSTFPSRRSLVWMLRCMFCLGSMWRVCKRSKLSVLLMMLGKWEWMAHCCSSWETSCVPPWGGLWMGTDSCVFNFCLEQMHNRCFRRKHLLIRGEARDGETGKGWSSGKCLSIWIYIKLYKISISVG